MRNSYDYDSVIRKDLIGAEEIQKKWKEDITSEETWKTMTKYPSSLG